MKRIELVKKVELQKQDYTSQKPRFFYDKSRFFWVTRLPTEMFVYLAVLGPTAQWKRVRRMQIERGFNPRVEVKVFHSDKTSKAGL